MDNLITALAPAFAAGMGIQQLGELLDPILEKISPNNKRVVMGFVSLSIGLAIAFAGGLDALYPFSEQKHYYTNHFVTGLLISGGTEGFNSIMKFLKYTKEDKKNEAAAKAPAGAGATPAPVSPATPGAAPAPTTPVASTAALQDLNRK